MTEMRMEPGSEPEAVAMLLRMADLRVDQDRLQELAALLSAAIRAGACLDAAAARIPLEKALAQFDPAWPAGEQ